MASFVSLSKSSSVHEGARVASPLGKGEDDCRAVAQRRREVRGGFVEQPALFALTQPSPSPLPWQGRGDRCSHPDHLCTKKPVSCLGNLNMTMLLCVGEILERVCRRRMEEILDMTKSAQRKALAANICVWSSATIQRNECLRAAGRNRAQYPFALANSSSTIQTDCALLLSHNV